MAGVQTRDHDLFPRDMKLLPFDYAVRNLGRRPLRTGLGVAGSVLVVLIVSTAMAFVRGMRESLLVTAVPANVILLGAGSEESIERSQIDARVATIAEASVPSIRSRLGVGFVSPEIHAALMTGVGSDEGTLTVVRGVTERAFMVHPQVRLTAGRLPEAGADEVVVGALVAQQLGVMDHQLQVGSELTVDSRSWTVVGLISAPGTVMDGEVWMPLDDVKIVARRDSLSCVVMTLESASGYPDVEAFAAQRLDLEVTAMREEDYYREMAAFLAPVRQSILVTALLMALGGLLGGINTMYAAFASRVREIGALQVLGFRRAAILATLLQESLVLNATGAILGVGAALALVDGISIRMSMGSFGLAVDGPVIAAGLGTGIALGIIGAIPPAWRCLRLPVARALRSN